MKKFEFKERKSITYIWKTLKILTFIIFAYTAGVMFKLRNVDTTIQIIFAISFFLIFNKMESMNKRIKQLEER